MRYCQEAPFTNGATIMKLTIIDAPLDTPMKSYAKYTEKEQIELWIELQIVIKGIK